MVQALSAMSSHDLKILFLNKSDCSILPPTDRKKAVDENQWDCLVTVDGFLFYSSVF